MIVKFAYDQLTNPQVRKLRDRELKVLDQAVQGNFEFKGFKIKTYHWQGGDQEVFLVHGWEGQAGNFSDLIVRLLAEGYSVRAFDGPSHGFSSRGKTSLFEFTELVGVLLKEYGTTNLISHSFGGVAATYALFSNPEIEISKYVLLTTPDKFLERIDDVVKLTGVSRKVKARLIARLEKELNVRAESLNVSDFVKEINVSKALIIHDRDDQVIPISRSLNVHRNWKESAFREISGTGHFRILRTGSVHEIVLDFLS